MSISCKSWVANVLTASVLLFASGFCEAQPAPAHQETVPMDPQLAALNQKAMQARRSGELFLARSLYAQILSEFPQAPQFSQMQKQFWDVNVAIIRSPLRSRQADIYVIHDGDTLGNIARKMGTTIELIKVRNQLETDRITAGHKLSVWKGKFWISIDKSDNTLALKVGDELVKIYPVSTGKNNSSPVGEYTIKYRYTHPVWFHKGEIVPADDPKNFLGTRWLGFDLPKYGIHGTIEPELIGKSVSSGCIRMRNEDVQELYDLVPIGTKVVIVD